MTNNSQPEERTENAPKTKNWFARHKILTVIIVIFVLGTIGILTTDDSSNNTSTTITNQMQDTNTAQENAQEEPKEQIIKISARELYAKYEENELLADELYKDKLLEVSGIVDNVGKDILDDPFVSLKTDNVVGSVQCMLADSELPKATQIKKGSSIILEGRNSGFLINVILRNCIIK